ncbi:MAG: hypothetical protein OXO51_15440 [Gemmatimonadota bacterium]|nr:hypothetical protein [Gemmatimonadota bacterium]
MKSVPCFIMFISLLACSDPSGNGMSDNPVGLSYSTIANQSVTEPSDSTSSNGSDSLVVVDLAGSSFRLVNTSGGDIIGLNKNYIVLADWKMKAWNGSNPDSLVDITGPEYIDLLEVRKRDIYTWAFDVSCGQTLITRAWTHGPHVYGKSHFVAFSRTPSVKKPHEEGGFYHEDIHFSGPVPKECQDQTLRVYNQINTVDEHGFGADVEGGGMRLINNVFQVESNRFFTATELEIVYHPVAPDTATAIQEAIRFDAILEDRRGWTDRIAAAMPVTGLRWSIGDPIIVPTRPEGHDPQDEALDIMLDRYGWNDIQRYESRTFRVVHIGLISTDVGRDRYKTNQVGGKAFLGGGISTVYYDPWFSNTRQGYGTGYGTDYSTLIHELGHNFGLIHTQDDPNYPIYPSVELDMDGYRYDHYGLVDFIDRRFHDTVMSYSVRPRWVSNYTWEGIVSFMYPSTPGVNARVVAGHGDITTWDHSH